MNTENMIDIPYVNIEIEIPYLFDSNNINYESSKEIKKQIFQSKKDAKTKTIISKRRESLNSLLPESIEKNTYYHLVSDGSYDYFTFVDVIVDKLKSIDEFIGSTWTMNRNNVKTLLKYYDEKKIKSIDVITGLYFKRRETAVYAELATGIEKRRQRLKSLKNHSKIILMSNIKQDIYIVIEGSANWTGNPRIEQNVVTNNKELYYFHKGWINKIFEK